MTKAYIVRYGEIALKGRNRIDFEEMLVRNIKLCLKAHKTAFSEVKRTFGRIIVYSNDDCGCLADVYGIVSISPAVETEIDIGRIKEEALKHYTKGTFRVSSQRMEKKLGTSLEMNKDIGAYVVDKTNAKVSLKNPDVDIGVEIVNKKAYIFNKKIEGAGGIPAGITGIVAVLVEDRNAIKAAKLMMKRGCDVVFVNKANIPAEELEKEMNGLRLKITKSVPKYAEAVVVSDTLSTFKQRDYNVPVLRPLIME
ncbi:MAG: THUMP domain-containing protein [Candidatus Nanoarchaeia archaeon]|nr:THUMP domain-containing protein [Candidatus Nanoarchaeia archaeon]